MILVDLNGSHIIGRNIICSYSVSPLQKIHIFHIEIFHFLAVETDTSGLTDFQSRHLFNYIADNTV